MAPVVSDPIVRVLDDLPAGQIVASVFPASKEPDQGRFGEELVKHFTLYIGLVVKLPPPSYTAEHEREAAFFRQSGFLKFEHFPACSVPGGDGPSE